MEAEATKGVLGRPSSAIETFPRDLLPRLTGGNSSSSYNEQAAVPGGEPDEVELDLDLDLGLSLGGCFGVDPKGKKLVRSSSIASFTPIPREQEFPVVNPILVRTSSLPTETEDARRKRKVLQGLKRLEAKRKRLEKRNSIKSGSGPAKPDVGMDAGKTLAAPIAIGGRLDLPIGSQFTGVFNVAIPPGLPKSAAAQGSSRPPGSSSSSVFELENQTPTQGFNPPVVSNNANVNTSLTPEVGKPVGGEEDPSKTVATATSGANLGRDVMGEMPCVSTMGVGPNGRRIEGFLYKYKKGEDVRIVCVCHGNFLTPAEFVKHAGGGDVTHPMRHIVVCPTPASFF